MDSTSTAQSGKVFRKKTLRNLVIDTDAEEKEQLRAQSAQNISNKKFNFGGLDAEKKKQIDETMEKLQKLEDQRNILLRDLDRLREGAVNALVEKEQVIERLKVKVEEVEQSREALGQQKKREYFDLYNQLEQAVQKVEEYKKEVEMLRLEHLAQVAKRDSLIYELGQQLEQSKLRLQELSQSEKTLSEKFNQAQSQKQELQDELVRSRINIHQLKQSLNNSQPGISQNSVVQQFSMKSHDVHRKNSYGQELRLKTDESLEAHRHAVWDEIQEKQIQMLIQENNREKERHAKEVEELKKYYEQKLQQTRSKMEVQRSPGLTKTQSLSMVRRQLEYANASKKKQTSGLRQQVMEAERQPSEQIEDIDMVEAPEPNDAISQFSSRHFQYDRPTQQIQERTKSRRQIASDPIEEMEPAEEKDQNLLVQWSKKLGLVGWVTAGLTFSCVVLLYAKLRR